MFHQVLYICIGNSTFESNTVTGSDGAGGAVYGSLSHITVDNSIFSYNNIIAKEKGAAFYLFL